MNVKTIVWLLKIAATMMIVGTVTIDIAVLLAWLGCGLVEATWSAFPLWIVLVTCFGSFLNFLIASFLFGVSKQAATTSGAEAKDLPLDERFSDTIDEGWTVTLHLAKLTSIVVPVLVAGTVAFFFNDLRFLLGLHKGMELNAVGKPQEAGNWFRVSIDSAGSDRIAIARFLLAGSLIREQKFSEAEAELDRVLKELDEKNEDHQALLVYVYSSMSNCYMFQNKLPEAELWTNKAIKMLEDHPQMFGLRFRMIGSYKQFLIPEPPPLPVAISGLNDIFMLEKKPDLALTTYKRILKTLEKQPKLTQNDVFDELERFEGQLRRLPEEQIAPQLQSAIAASVDLAVSKCNLKNAAQFNSDFETYLREKHVKR